jgi:RNA polymerase sigma factor (sigma-70 family)
MSSGATKLSKRDFEFYKTKAYFIAKQVGNGYSTDDLIGWGLVSLAKSLKSYVPDSKMSLHNYILQHMRWDMLDALRLTRLESRDDVKKGVSYREVSYEDGEEPACDLEINTDTLDLRKAVKKLPRKCRRFIEAYFAKGDLQEAARELGISKECGYQHHFQAIQALRTLLTADLTTPG